MPKKHDLFPPHFKVISSIYAVILGFVFTAWTIDYFIKSLHVNFPLLFLIVILSYIIITVFIIVHEYEEKQTLEDNYKALDNNYQNAKEKLKNSSSVELGRSGDDIHIKASRKDLADPNFIKDVNSFVRNYDELNEKDKKELREKWKEEGRKEIEDMILNGKW